ncbi:MAG TPA: hypothetical protein VL595_11630 [Pseudonocardia sp.]|nr:hypothetical protein [Pseudonocardia sp.]
MVTGADGADAANPLSVTGGAALPAGAAIGHVGDVEGVAAAGQVDPGAPDAGAGWRG